MGLRTTVWGPPLWAGLFYIALDYEWNTHPDKDEHFVRFFESLANVLPCHYCVSYFRLILEEYPLRQYLKEARERGEQHACFRWVYEAKAMVNMKLIRQERACLLARFKEIEEDDTLDRYEKHEARADARKRILYTQSSPPIEEVFEQYIGAKSDCNLPLNQQLQSCRHISGE